MKMMCNTLFAGVYSEDYQIPAAKDSSIKQAIERVLLIATFLDFVATLLVNCNMNFQPTFQSSDFFSVRTCYFTRKLCVRASIWLAWRIKKTASTPVVTGKLYGLTRHLVTMSPLT